MARRLAPLPLVAFRIDAEAKRALDKIARSLTLEPVPGRPTMRSDSRSAAIRLALIRTAEALAA